MRFLLVLLLIIPIITASGEHKSESHEDTKGGKKLKKAQALRETVKGNTKFAINFFKHVTSVSSQSKDSHAKNVVVSPIGISSAFSMLLLGTRTKTHQEIWEGLSLNNTHCKEKDVHRAYSSLLQALNEPKSSLQVDIGNAVFVQDTLALLKSFEDDVQHYYHAEIKKTNFINSQEAKKEINEYVKNKTEGKIEKLIKELSANAKMVLINYVRFKGEWQNPFHPRSTSVKKFFLDSNTTVDVQMMERTGRYNTYQDTQLPCTVVELPYKDNASMIIAIAEPGKIHEVEQGLSTETIQRWKTSFRNGMIRLSLPKFFISSTVKLEDALPELGIRTAFTDAADFSGITHDVAFKVGKAVHKAVLNVDEKGTVASAATGLELIPLAAYPRIVANHPFFTIIYDKTTNTILFIGTITNPIES
ncbi:serine protease inhibitor A6-like [Pyxicephalus adspersus]|uniref:Thyroxine-binding globulin n=1 Tax=Pyxicephalus adspersus TaxID=30357 RepID=A0AAV2ZWK0_PYXAD|nr:TPA: hypothetical protein GDO54_005410 [Pyxicephalus adspersus]